MQLPDEGFRPAPGIFNYIKDIQPLNPKQKEVYAFTALSNTSSKGTGKVWRRVIYIYLPANDSWRFLSEIRAGTSWRGLTYNVCFWPYDSRVVDKKWVEARFQEESDAEQFLMDNWEFFV